eukprot:305352_1
MASDTSILRTFLKKEGIYDKDIEETLLDMNVSDPRTDFKEFTQTQWNELHRRVIVERINELKDQSAKARMENKLEKLESHWRNQSGIKRVNNTVITDDGDMKQSEYDTIKSAKYKKLLEKAHQLKIFLQKNDCFSMELLAILSDQGVNKEEDIVNIQTNMEWGQIEREMRVAQRQKVKDNASKRRTDKIVKKFEKIWRKRSGLKSTSIIKGNKKEMSSNTQCTETKGKELKQWMKKNGIWHKDLYQELI